MAAHLLPVKASGDDLPGPARPDEFHVDSDVGEALVALRGGA
jgi:hypothetical protein